MSCAGAVAAGSQTNQPPIGPRSSTWSPGSSASVRYGETSPSSRRCTVSSRRSPPGQVTGAAGHVKNQGAGGGGLPARPGEGGDAPGDTPRRARDRGQSVALVTLLAPRVAVVVVAELFPEAMAVAGHQVQAGDPLSGLPEVQV